MRPGRWWHPSALPPPVPPRPSPLASHSGCSQRGRRSQPLWRPSFVSPGLFLTDRPPHPPPPLFVDRTAHNGIGNGGGNGRPSALVPVVSSLSPPPLNPAPSFFFALLRRRLSSSSCVVLLLMLMLRSVAGRVTSSTKRPPGTRDELMYQNTSKTSSAQRRLRAAYAARIRWAGGAGAACRSRVETCGLFPLFQLFAAQHGAVVPATPYHTERCFVSFSSPLFRTCHLAGPALFPFFFSPKPVLPRNHHGYLSKDAKEREGTSW